MSKARWHVPAYLLREPGMRAVRTVALIAAIAAVGLAPTAEAITLTYDFNLTAPNGTPVTDLVLYAAGAGQDDVYLSPTILPASGISHLSHSVDFIPTDALVIGVSKRTTEEKWDLVMFTTSAFAADALGLFFNELFPADRNPRHGALTLLLQAAHDGDADSLNAVTAFLRGADASEAYFNPFGPFSIIQYSIVEPPIGGSIPEPAMLAILGLGISGLVLLGRRRDNATPRLGRG